MSYPFWRCLFVRSCTSVNYPSLFSPTCLVTLLLIANEFGTVFGLGVQSLETLEELEIRYSQALAKPERETLSHNRLLEALKATHIAFCLPVFSRFFIAAVCSIEA